ncbi:THO complex subunit 2, partial [Podochytrium sp. JEL0797]
MTSSFSSLLLSAEKSRDGRDALLAATAHALKHTSVAHVESLVFVLAQAATQGRIAAKFAADTLRTVFLQSRGALNKLSVADVAASVGATGLSDPLLVPSALCDALFLLDMQQQPLDVSFAEPTDPLANTQRTALVTLAKHIVALDFVPQLMLKERLEPEFLEKIALLQNAKLFQRKTVRINTTLTYKQQKFNLLREESEGFAMLETYLQTSLPPAFPAFWATTTHNQSPPLDHAQVQLLYTHHVQTKVKSVLENVTSLIGYFDLNPNKVLDVILDVFVANVVDHWSFFVELLENSHWGSGGAAADSSSSSAGPKLGNPVLGQILGFKFSYYNNPLTNIATTPSPLIWITAILIKHKLVQMEDIYPHLSPADEDMPLELKTFQDKMNALKKLGGKYKDTTLADAGALGDSSSSSNNDAFIKERHHSSSNDRQSTPSHSTTTDSFPTTPKPRAKTNQKAVLAAHLLALGSLTSARQILDRCPVLIQTHPEISEAMSRILHTCLEPIYATLRPIHTRTPLTTLPATQPPPLNTLNYALAQKSVTVGRRLHYAKLQFFYAGWAEGLPQCKTLEEVVKVLRVLLPYVSVSMDVVLVAKVARVGRAHVLA